MEDDEDPPSESDGIIFRNKTSIEAVLWQTIIILTGVLAVTSFIYVFIMLLFLTIHHRLKERQSTIVPEFVHDAYQFSSDEESLDEEEMAVLARYEVYIQKGLYKDGKVKLPMKKLFP